MVEFRPMLAGDLVQLKLQPSQWFELGIEESEIDMVRARELVARGPAWTAHDGGRILACGGFAETFPPVQAVAWAMLTTEIGAVQGGKITAYVRDLVANAPYRRLEAVVDAWNERAIAWANRIGLEAAHTLQCFGFKSEPHILFERVRL